MPKILSILLCLLVLLPCALAEWPQLTPTLPPMGDAGLETPEPNPFSDFLPDATQPPQASEAPADAQTVGAGTMLIILDGELAALEFDSDPEYSRVEDGYIYASFYALASDGTSFEVMLIVPEDVVSGDVITPQSSASNGLIDSGIMLLIQSDTEEVFAAASQDEQGIYPEGSSYAIRMDEVKQEGATCHFQGTLEAELVILDDDYVSIGTYSGVTASFDFTMNISPDAQPESPSFQTPQTSLPPELHKV